MFTQIVGEQLRWQDLKVRSELDIVLEIAKQEGWKDCEVFGYGDMITQPQESLGWDLIPADVYEHSIPPEAVARLHQVINSGVRVQGVIIADDQRRERSAAASPAPAKPGFSQRFFQPVAGGIAKAWTGLTTSAIRFTSQALSFAGKVFVALLGLAGALALVATGWYMLSNCPWLLLPLGFFTLLGAGTGTSTGGGSSWDYDYDPKLVILVDDGNGGTAWVSLFTWYD